MEHGMKAAELFLQGYNCAQSVLLAFEDMTGLDQSMALRLSSSFGGGMARLREVCGAVSGMAMVAGLLYGYDDISDITLKKEHYARIQELAAAFRERAGSIICREILNDPPTDSAPSPRTEEYYRVRPCARMVLIAGEVLDAYVDAHPIS